MTSLRARLVAAVLAIAAVGLVTLAAIVYFEQRSFLLDRAAEQARDGAGAVAGALAQRGIGEHDEPDRDRPGPPAARRRPRRRPAGRHLRRAADGRQDLPRGLRLRAERRRLAEDPEEAHRRRADRPSPATAATTTATASSPPPSGQGEVAVVAVPLNDAYETLSRLVLVEGLVIVGILLVLAAVAWVVVRNSLLPLDRIGHTAGRIAGGDLSHRVEATDERTEVGRVGVALNRMLDRLEQAFTERRASEDRLRQFIGDASHELRTPLASIRGYAELFRMGAAREPEDVEKAMRRIEDEAARMGVLVEDLLTLARLDQVVDAPHAEVDLAHLARDTVSDALATAPDRPIDVHADGPAVVLGDAHQLRQVLGNLVRNALVHTPADSAIDVTVGREDGEVRLEVRDHGPGLPTDEPNELFERFWRAEGGRERGKSGAGLGLAIVAAIVAAHDGRVSAANADGGGAAFTVVLPAA